MRAGLARSLLMAFALFVPGCPTWKQDVARIGMEAAADCGADVLPGYYDFRAAIHDGGASWLSVIGDAGKCIASIVADEIHAHNCTSASLDPPAYRAAPATPAELGRARAALAISRLSQAVTLPGVK